MTPEDQFIIEHWEKKSNAILGFVVIQSIILSDGLSKDEFIDKIKSVSNLILYIFFAHTFIAISAVILLILIDKKISRKLGDNKVLKNDIELHFTLVVKVLLAMIFGVIPIFIFFKNLF
ncbi:MAG: hypothetical protein JWQ09_2044 [Segetibacter sp.]|nr:hypothetical protein [Segetibacter sp.]